MKLTKLINEISLNPKKLFLIDGIGAIVSVFLLGIVLVKLESIFGIPRKTLFLLAFFPFVFAMYDFYCYFRIHKNFGLFLKIIAFLNLLYCFLSIGLAFYQHHKLTSFGWLYIIFEIIIITALVILELRIAAHINSVE